MMPLVPEQQQAMPIQKQVTYQNVAVQINPTPDRWRQQRLADLLARLRVEREHEHLACSLDDEGDDGAAVEVPRPMPNGGASRRHH